MKIRLASFLLTFLLLGTVAVCATELTGEQKERLINAIGKRLENKAFAFGTDFTDWKTFVQKRASEIEKAQTKEELAGTLGEALGEFDLSHLGIFAPAKAKLRRAGKRAGVGITIHPVDKLGGLISYVLADSPAERCGLRKGDIITQVDGTPFTELKQLAGTVGQKRTIHWKRGDNVMSCIIEYAAFSSAEKSSMRWINEDVALIRIQSFQYRYYQSLKVSRFFRQAKDAKAIIIDLRNNRGGLSVNARHLASKFSTQSETFAQITTRKHRLGDHRVIRPLPSLSRYRGQIIVLTDSLSASAADIVPAFVSESGRGIVIGEKTSGALQLARTFTLPYGFRIYLPIAEMLTPDGNRLEGVGFKPDLELSLEETIDDDTILDVALAEIEKAHLSSEE